MSTREEVYAVIDGERDYQQAMIAHAGRYQEVSKPMEAYALYISDYAAELNTQLSRVWGPESEEKARHTLRKVAALAVAALETHGAVPRVCATRHAEGADLTKVVEPCD